MVHRSGVYYSICYDGVHDYVATRSGAIGNVIMYAIIGAILLAAVMQREHARERKSEKKRGLNNDTETTDKPTKWDSLAP